MNLVFLVIILGLCFFMFLNNSKNEYIYITIENQKFKVSKYKNYEISYGIATRLHNLKKIDFLIKHIHSSEKIEAINRLKNKYKGVLEDSNILKKTRFVGYNI